MPDVRKLHDESVAKLGTGTRKEMGQVRKDSFRRPENQTGLPGGKPTGRKGDRK
jgi:hypothetical protein